MKNLLSTFIIVATIGAFFPVNFAEATSQAQTDRACPLTFNTDDYRIDLEQKVLYGSQSPRQVRTNVTDIPKGRFEVQIATYGGPRGGNLNRNKNESVKVSFRNGSDVIDKAQLASKDIGENNPAKKSNLGKVTLYEEINNILVRHAEADKTNKNDGSVTALCIRLRPVFVIKDDLQVTCSPSEDTIEIGEQVTWAASAAGGTGTFSYQWGNGDTGISTRDSYIAPGTITQTVIVNDGDETSVANCSVDIVEDDGDDTNNSTINAQCNVSDTTIREGDVVEFEADARGGSGDYDYDWDWDIDGRNEEERVRFTQEGTYQVRLTVRDDEGNMDVDVCPTIRVDNDFDDDNDNNNDDDDELDLRCRVSDRRINEGDIVEYEVEIDGGNGPFDIEWRGDIRGDDETERIRYTREGRYEVEVEVTDDDGERERVSCPDVEVDEEDRINYSNTGANVSFTGGSNYSNYSNSGSGHLASAGNIFSLFGGNTNTSNNTSGTIQTYSGGTYVPTGQNAGVNSVLLSQVPYTGPADVLKVIGGILLAIGLALTGAYYMKGRRKESTISNNIEAFKEMNKKATRIA